MSNGLTGIIAALETLACYDGPWRALRDEKELLQARLAELRERENRLDDVLLVALVGGSGVGKSTLLNALAGDQIAATSEMRPCTSAPTVYHPPGMKFTLTNLENVNHVARSALEHIALIDTPDSDTIVKEHRSIVQQVLQECDLIVLCADGEKYLDEATWSLLRPLVGLRAFVCVETRVMREDTAIQNDWTRRLKDNGFQVDQYFRVNALRALDRKLAAATAGATGDEFDFTALEQYLRHELDRERVARIKSSNAAGLLARTVERLHGLIVREEPTLVALTATLTEADRELADITMRHFTAGILAEPHLWVQALGKEVGMRAKGGIGTLYKILELIRSIPHRLPVWLGFDGYGRGEIDKINSLFTATPDSASHDTLPETLLMRYSNLHSELRMHFIRAGLDMPAEFEQDTYQHEMNRRIRSAFSGAIHDRLVAKARLLTAWPLALLLDALPMLFLGYTSYLVVVAYLQGNLLPTTSFLHAGMVFFMLIALELAFLAVGVRFLAWGARRRGIADLKKTLNAPGLAFTHEKEMLAAISETAQLIRQVHTDITAA